MHPLPQFAQFAPIYGMVVDDFDNDGNLDVAAVGNDWGTEVTIGRYDAMNGLVLRGDGKGGFTCETILQSGLFIPGNAKAVVKLMGKKDGYLLAVSQNRDLLKIYRERKNDKLVRLLPADAYAIIYMKNGSKRKEEVYHGTSFLSQSCMFIPANANIAQIDIVNNKGEKRQLRF